MRCINYFIGLLSVLMLGACNDQYKDSSEFYQNYIQGYYQGELVLRDWGSVLPPEIPINPENTPIKHFYIVLANGQLISPTSVYAEEYERLAVRNGDISFNSWADYSERVPPSAFADNFQTLHITSNADWDEAHPAGTFLDDILQISIYSFADYIHSGYKGTTSTDKEMLISELTPADMEMVEYDWFGVGIYFTNTPTIEPIHTLTVEWTTVEGEVKTASLTCRPEVDPELQL